MAPSTTHDAHTHSATTADTEAAARSGRGNAWPMTRPATSAGSPANYWQCGDQNRDKRHKQQDHDHKEVNLSRVGVLPNHGPFQFVCQCHNGRRCNRRRHEAKLQPDQAAIPHLEHVGSWQLAGNKAQQVPPQACGRSHPAQQSAKQGRGKAHTGSLYNTRHKLQRKFKMHHCIALHWVQKLWGFC